MQVEEDVKGLARAAPSSPSPLESSLTALRAAIAELSRTAERGGTGLQLSVAARIIEARARELVHELDQRADVSSAALVKPPVRATPDLFRVLLVEDDADSVALMAQALSPWFQVRAAHSSSEAAAMLEQEVPDVVVTDLYFPESSGLDLLELVRTAGDLTHIPVIVVSGRADTDAKVQAFESGAFDFVSKPFHPEELVARIRNALAHSQVLRRERVLGGRDDLTGLANRRTFRVFLDSALSSARRNATPLVVMLVDQDRLKHINDTYGHAAGDDALRILAEALSGSSRGSDCAARVGGDEFALVMPGSDREGAEALLARMREALEKHPLTVAPGKEVQVEASFGFACFGEDGPDETADHLLRRADDDLYAHKRLKNGRERAAGA